MTITEDGGFGPVAEPFEPGDCSTELLVIAPDRAAVTRALRRVCVRLGHVLCDGREVDDPLKSEYVDANVFTAGVFAPDQCVRRVAIGVDFKSEDLSAAMGATYRQIVKEELRREGVQDASLALPDTSDRETIGEGMFASFGVPSLAFRVELGPLLAVVQEHAPEGALMMWDAQFASPPMRAFLERYGRHDASPLAYLSEWPAVPLDPETSSAFRQAAAERDPVISAPVWVVHDDRVLAFAWSSYGSWVRVCADADPPFVDAVAALHREPEQATGPHVAGIEWAADRAAREHLALTPVPPVHAEWWHRAWRTSEPLPPLPDEPPAPFDRLDAAVRLNASAVRAPGRRPPWRWRRPLFGPRLTAEEAAAWLHLFGWSDDTISPLAVALEVTRYVPGAFGFGEACRCARGDRLPAAARLTALVAIGGARQTLDWLLRVKPDPTNPWAVVYSPQGALARGVRAGLLPHLDEATRIQLAERARARRQATPWTGGPAPTIEHLLVGVDGPDDREAPDWA